MSGINKMGSVKSLEMDGEAQLIWEFISTQNNWLTATHIPGVFNEDADRESRKQEVRTESMLNRKNFHCACFFFSQHFYNQGQAEIGKISSK